MLVFFQEFANRLDGLILAGIAYQIQRFIFAQRMPFVWDSGAFHDRGDTGRICQGHQVRKRREVLIHPAYETLDRGPPGS